MIVRMDGLQGLRGLGDESGASTSKLIWWPNDIKALAKQTDTEIRSLAADYEQSSRTGAIDSDALASFNTFYNEWADYHDGLGFLNFLSGGTVGTLQSYRLRANGWRSALVSSGGRTSSPAPTNLPSDKPSELASALRWVAGAAIVVAGVYGVTQLVRVVRVASPLVPARANPRRKRRRRKRR